MVINQVAPANSRLSHNPISICHILIINMFWAFHNFAYMFMLVFRSIFQHIHKAPHFVLNLNFQRLKASSKSEIPQISQRKASLSMPQFTINEENSLKQTELNVEFHLENWLSLRSRSITYQVVDVSVLVTVPAINQVDHRSRDDKEPSSLVRCHLKWWSALNPNEGRWYSICTILWRIARLCPNDDDSTSTWRGSCRKVEFVVDLIIVIQ